MPVSVRSPQSALFQNFIRQTKGNCTCTFSQELVYFAHQILCRVSREVPGIRQRSFGSEDVRYQAALFFCVFAEPDILQFVL